MGVSAERLGTDRLSCSVIHITFLCLPQFTSAFFAEASAGPLDDPSG